MVIFGNEPLPDDTGDAPDWTYEELIDAFVKDYSVRWLELRRKLATHGIIGEWYLQLIVELRPLPTEPAPYNLDLQTFLNLPEYRFWLLAKDGLEEIDYAEYHDLVDHPNVKNSPSFSTFKFCFENNNHFIMSEYMQVRGGWGVVRKRVARGSDGKLYSDELRTLAMN